VTKSDICSWFKTLTQELQNNRRRSLVILHGDFQWMSEVSSDLLKLYHQDKARVKTLRSITWGQSVVDDQKSVVIENFRHHLGCENDIVLFNDCAFHPDAFAALSGTIVAGGVLIWLCSPESILDVDNLFIQRIWAKAQKDKYSFILSQAEADLPNVCLQEQEFEHKTGLKRQTEVKFNPVEGGCKTNEQQCAVDAIEKVVLGHRKRPLVLTADRGRGKSSALAIAVARRLMSKSTNDPQKIVVTAPHIDALAIFFKQLQYSCPAGEYRKSAFTYKKQRVEFIAVDILIKEKPNAHLLLVDEAAAIPVYILSQLVDDYHRIVFSSTQHGYEGAGRGFAIKFKQILSQKTPSFSQFHIHQPIRWEANDSLEAFVFDTFLLNSIKENYCFSHDADEECFHISNAIFKRIEQQQLFENEHLLQQVFSVLVTAHYQTAPSDLKLLLNNQAVRLFVLEVESQIIAVALTLKEGEAESQSINDVAQAKLRLKNQFLPQSLFLHNHCSTAFNYQYLRIMRIAVLPSFQHQGFGLRLLAEIKQYAQQNHIDMLGTSFGANNSLLNFWHKADYRIVRLGFSVDKASGEHSTMFLQPLTSDALKLLDELQTQFYRSFIYLLTEQFQQLSVKVVTRIINQWPKEKLLKLTDFDVQVVHDFIERKSLFDACAYSLHIQLIHQLANISLTSSQGIRGGAKVNEMLVKRILQKQKSSTIYQMFGLTGKKQLNNAMIDAFKAIIAKH
jgi:tRNA(Met) cytidine acetyltransferase